MKSYSFFKGLGLVLLMIQLSCTTTTTDTSMNLLVGTYTGEGSEGIYQLSFNPREGALSDLKLVARVKNPSFVTVSADKSRVYSVGEGASSALFTWEWAGTDSLKLLEKHPASGRGSCYVAVNNHWAALANYGSGSVTMYPLDAKGVPVGEPFAYSHKGSGPDTTRQEGPHAHCAVFSPDERFIYVADLGTDQVMAYPIKGNQIDSGFVAAQLEPGDGPRHLTFHPNGQFAFLMNELSNTVASFRIDTMSGKLIQVDRAYTLPEDFTDFSKSADIHISQDGKFLYTSNRGHNSIAVFAVDAEARLQHLDWATEGINWPRNFSVSPDGSHLLVANRHANTITVYRRDEATGLLTYTGNQVQVSQPVCLKFY